MKYLTPILILPLIGFLSSLTAKITEVHAGGLQSAINLASEGDTLVLHEGDYEEEITIQKSITIAPILNGKVFISGKIKLNNILKKIVIRGLNTNSDFEILNCVNVYISNSYFKGITEISNSNTFLHKTNFGDNFTINEGCHSVIIKCAFSKHVQNLDTGRTFTIVRSSVNGALLSLSQKSWINYNKISCIAVKGYCEIVGNEFGGERNDKIYKTSGNGSHDGGETNNPPDLTKGFTGEPWSHAVACVHLFGKNSHIRFNNNTVSSDMGQITGFYNLRGDGTKYGRAGSALYVHPDARCDIINNDFYSSGYITCVGRSSSSSWVKVLGNKFVTASAPAIYSHFEKISISNNILSNIEGGAASNNTIEDPSSDGVDLGPQEAEFNDHDGTRNDIGANGGHKFDPEGWTTDNPIVLMNRLEATYVKKGTATLRLTTRGATPTVK
jgi:hypothetical protein